MVTKTTKTVTNMMLATSQSCHHITSLTFVTNIDVAYTQYTQAQCEQSASEILVPVVINSMHFWENNIQGIVPS